jgi:hypothetical protein
MKSKFWVILLILSLLLLVTGCNDSDKSAEPQVSETDQVSENPADKEVKVQFSYAARYARELNEFYVVAGKHARIPIRYDVIITAPGNEDRKFKVVITPREGADPIEGIYETSAETFNKDYNEHLIMVDDLRQIYSIYAPTLEASCQVYDITTSEDLIFEGTASVPALEARELELLSLEVKETSVSATVTHHEDMEYEWRMNTRNDLALAPQSGSMGWSSEGFLLDDETEIAVTIYDEQGRFNNFLFVYPK